MRLPLFHAALLLCLPPATALAASEERITPELQEKVVSFLEHFIDPAKTPAEQAALFAEEVDYYEHGKVDRKDIVRDVQRYVRHFPQRSYWLEDVSYINADPDSDRIYVAYSIGYAVANRSKSLTGKANYGAVIDNPETAPKVVSIKERITQRKPAATGNE